MSINTKKGPNLQKIQSSKKARLFDELSITMYYCRLVLYLYPDFKEIISNFPPNEMEAEELYNLSTDRYYDEGIKDKCDEISRIINDSMKSRRMPFFDGQSELFLDFGASDKKTKKLNDKRFLSIVKDYQKKRDFGAWSLETLLLDIIIYDLQKIPSSVVFSDESSFETLAVDCNDLSNFYSSISRIFWEINNDNQKMRFNTMLNAVETVEFNLTSIANQLVGYWSQKLERKKSSQPGAQAQKSARDKRAKSVIELVEKVGRLTDSGFEISKSVFHNIIYDVFGYNYVSPRTIKKYCNHTSEMLSQKNGKEIKLILKK